MFGGGKDMELASVFWNKHSEEMTQENYMDLKNRMLKAARFWSKGSNPSWTETENELKAYGDYSGWHDSHDDSSSSTCWIDFYKAIDSLSEQEWTSGIEDRYEMIHDIPCKRSVAIQDASYYDAWRDHILYYLLQPYGLQGVWVLSFKKYKD